MKNQQTKTVVLCCSPDEDLEFCVGIEVWVGRHSMR